MKKQDYINSHAQIANNKWVVTYDVKEMETARVMKTQVGKTNYFLLNKEEFENSRMRTWSAGEFGFNSIENIFAGNSQFEPNIDSANAEKLNFKSIKRRKKYSEESGNLCFDRYAQGNELCYIQKHKRTQEDKTSSLVIYISSSACGSTDAAEIQKFVFQVLNYVEQKQRAGFSVEVWHTKYNRNGLNGYYSNIITRTKLKEAGQYIDFKRIATACYPAMHRFIAFRSFLVTGEKLNKKLGQPIGGEEVVRVIEESYQHPNKKVIVFDFQDWEENGSKLPNLE